MNYYYADAAFVQQMGIKLLAGNNFSAGNLSSIPMEQILINEVAANNNLGFKHYTDAIGKRVQVNELYKMGDNR